MAAGRRSRSGTASWHRDHGIALKATPKAGKRASGKRALGQLKAVTVLDAVAWLLRQPEDTITVQELLDLCRTARR